MTVFDTAATAVLEQIASSLWGFKPNLMPHIVEQRGPFSALSWFVRNMPKYETTLKTWGPIRTHAVCTAISLSNGCPYCTSGHALALQLHVLRARDRLFPLDDAALRSLSGSGPEPIATALGRGLVDVGFGDDTDALHRWAAKNVDDTRIAHLNAMFSVLNACGIRGNVAADEAHDPINKDIALRRRYATLRAEADAARASSYSAA